MKKIITITLAALAVILIQSCSGASKHSSPSAIVEAQIKAIQDKDVEEFVMCMYFKKDNSEEAKKELANQFGEKITKSFDDKEGIKSYKILSEEINEEGDKAKVKTSITYGNGVEDETTSECIKVDDKWWIDSKK